MFEVDNLGNGWVKKDGVNANLVICAIGLTLATAIDFAFSPYLSLWSAGLRSGCQLSYENLNNIESPNFNVVNLHFE